MRWLPTSCCLTYLSIIHRSMTVRLFLEITELLRQPVIFRYLQIFLLIRHRAGVGISEVSDSVTLIVSEETGSISIAKGGELYRNLDTESVRKHLELLSQDDVKKKDERRLKDSKRRRKSTKKSTGKKTDSNNIKNGRSSDNRKEADSDER